MWTSEKRRIVRGGTPQKHLIRQGKLFWIRVKAPDEIDIFNPERRGPSAEFFANLRAHSRRRDVGVIVDLSDVSTIKPTGAVMLLAELDRLFAGQPDTTIRIYRARNPIIHAVMCQVGIYQWG